MTTQKVEKYCKECKQVKNRATDFYAAGPSIQSRCKPCYNTYHAALKRAKPKSTLQLNSFQKLPLEVREGLVRYIGTMPRTKLADRYQLRAINISRWNKRGWITL